MVRLRLGHFRHKQQIHPFNLQGDSHKTSHLGNPNLSHHVECTAEESN